MNGSHFDPAEFNPKQVVFDDPDDVWLYVYWEDAVLSAALETEDLDLLRLPDGRYPVKLPARTRDILVETGIAPAGKFAGAPDELLDIGFVTLLLTARDVGGLIDGIAMKSFESQDVRLARRFFRVDWYLNEAHRMMSEIDAAEDMD